MADYLFYTYFEEGREYFVYKDLTLERSHTKEKDFPLLESLLRFTYLDIWPMEGRFKEMDKALQNFYRERSFDSQAAVMGTLEELAKKHIYFEFLRLDWQARFRYMDHHPDEDVYMYRGQCLQFVENLGTCVTLYGGDVFLLNQNVTHALLQEDESAVLIKIIIQIGTLSQDFLRRLGRQQAGFWSGVGEYYHYLYYTGCTGDERLFIERMMTEFYSDNEYKEITQASRSVSVCRRGLMGAGGKRLAHSFVGSDKLHKSERWF